MGSRRQPAPPPTLRYTLHHHTVTSCVTASWHLRDSGHTSGSSLFLIQFYKYFSRILSSSFIVSVESFLGSFQVLTNKSINLSHFSFLWISYFQVFVSQRVLIKCSNISNISNGITFVLRNLRSIVNSLVNSYFIFLFSKDSLKSESDKTTMALKRQWSNCSTVLVSHPNKSCSRHSRAISLTPRWMRLACKTFYGWLCVLSHNPLLASFY